MEHAIDKFELELLAIGGEREKEEFIDEEEGI